MLKPVCLITGVGDTTGAALARRFAEGEYQVAMIARNRKRLEALEKEIGHSRAYVCDVSDLDTLLTTVDTIRREMGIPSILIHNAVSATFKTFLEADPNDLEKNFRVNVTSLLHLTRTLAPDMIKAGHGSIMVTGNTAAVRDIPNYAVFAPTKAAQRSLAESLARDLGPKGVHVSYIMIDAPIDATWFSDDSQRPKTPPDWKGKREDFFAKPAAIAEEVFHVAHQDRSTWSFDVIIRPFAENWW